MPRRGKRRTLATNIYEDHSGRSAVVRVREWRKERRFPASTPLTVIREWMTQQRARFGALSPTSAKGSLESDVRAYLDLVHYLSGWVSLRAELAAWVRLYGDFPRYVLTAADVLDARNVWLAEGLQPKTINNRVMALNRLWHRLDGPRSISPAQDVPPLPVHKTPPERVSDAAVRRVYETLKDWERSGRLKDAKTRARFMVVASTGKRPSEMMRAEMGDVDLERRVWNVRDGKGGWSPGIYLNRDMMTAWKVFMAADAWGRFREGAWVRTLRAAGWTGPGPYQLRHSVGISMTDAGIDLADIQQHLGHKRIETTRKHYVPVRGTRLQIASERIDRRFRWKA